MQRRAALGRLAALGAAGIGLSLPRGALALDDEQRADFERRFRAAFGEQNLDRAMALFHWSGVTSVDRDRIVTLILRDLGYAEILRVAWLPPGEGGEFSIGETRMRGNLPMAARFAVEFRTRTDERRVSVHDIGLHEGRCLIALAEPVPAAA